MTPEAAFSLANALALVSWAVLVLFQRRPLVTDRLLLAVPFVFAGAYVAIIVTQWMGSSGSFSSLEGVSTLFGNRWLLLAGWLHYLAFDLLIGCWEARDGREKRLSPFIVAPCLLVTFMFGPAGWLLYRGVRGAARRI